jgi:four helix bundle protein
MENPTPQSFNQQLRERTLNFSASVRDLFLSKKISILDRSAVIQLTRCSCSVSANFRAAARSRSDAEFFAKICIVTEEIDKAQHWLEYLQKIQVLSMEESADVKAECVELVRIFSCIKKKMKDRLER